MRPITMGGQRATSTAGPGREQRSHLHPRENRNIARLISAPADSRWAGGAEEEAEERVEFPPPIQRALRGETPAEDGTGEEGRGDEDGELRPIRVPTAEDPARRRPQTRAPRGASLPLSAVYHPRLRNRVRIRPAQPRDTKGGAPTPLPRPPATVHGRAPEHARPAPPRKPQHSAGSSTSPPRTRRSRASAATGPSSPGGDGVPPALAVQLPPTHVEVGPESQVRPPQADPSFSLCWLQLLTRAQEDRVFVEAQRFQADTRRHEQAKVASLRQELDRLRQRRTSLEQRVAEVESDRAALCVSLDQRASPAPVCSGRTHPPVP